MSKQNENTAIVEQNSGFLALANTDFAALVSEELAGLDIGFERIKIPSGGATMFEMPAEADEAEMVREFSGVILYQHPLNAYYAEKYTGGSNPPDCGSFDGIRGEGNPGGNCKKCPFAQFGTGENGAKACKNRRRVYILREGEVFPLLLSLPTGSLKAFTKYIKVQLSKGRKSNAVVTRFGLKKVTNAGGITYTQATFALDRLLTPEEHALIENMSAQIKAYSANVGYDTDTVAAEDDYIIDHETGEIVEPAEGGQ